MANKHVASTGAPWMVIITVVLAVLKTTGVISWSWWWVTLPLWGGLALGLGLIAFFTLLGVIGFGATALFSRKKRRF